MFTCFRPTLTIELCGTTRDEKNATYFLNIKRILHEEVRCSEGHNMNFLRINKSMEVN